MALKAQTNEKGEIIGYVDDATGERFNISRSLEVGAGPQGQVGVKETLDPGPIQQDFNLRAFLEGGFVEDLLTGAASETVRQLTRNAPNLLVRGASPFLAGMSMNLAASQARALLPQDAFKYYQNQEPSLGKSAKAAFIDRLYGRAGETVAALPGDVKAAKDLFKANLSQGVRKATGAGLSGAFEYRKNKLTQPLFEKFSKGLGKPPILKEELEDTAAYAKAYNAPDIAAFHLSDESRFGNIMQSAVSFRKKRDLFSQTAAANRKAIQDITKGKIVGIAGKEATTQDVAFKIANDLTKQREFLKADADSKWQFAKQFGAASNLEVGIEKQVAVPPSQVLTPQGVQFIPASTQTIVEPHIINEPINVTGIIPFASELKSSISSMVQSPSTLYANNPQMLSNLNKLDNLLGNLTSLSQDVKTKLFITSRANTAELRQAFDEVFQQASGVDKERLAEASKALRNGLSAAEDASIGDANLGWASGSDVAYRQAKDATISLKDKFGHNTTTDILTTKRTPTDYRTLEPEKELEILNSLKSAESVDRLVDAGAHPDDVGSLFVLQGWKRALNDDGTLDGAKLAEYFQDKSTNESILQNSKLFNRDQRTLIRQMTNYAKNGKFSEKSSQAGWQDNRVQSAMIGVPAILTVAASRGYIPPEFLISAGFLVGIPLTRMAVSKLMLSKEGAKVMMKRLYPTSPSQSFKTTQELLRLLPRGHQLYVSTKNGHQYPATVVENGQIEIQRPDEPNQ